MRSQNGGGGMSADAQLQIEDLNAQVFEKVCFLCCSSSKLLNRLGPNLFKNLWPNLKNLSGGLNLSRGLNMVGST